MLDKSGFPGMIYGKANGTLEVRCPGRGRMGRSEAVPDLMGWTCDQGGKVQG